MNKMERYPFNKTTLKKEEENRKILQRDKAINFILAGIAITLVIVLPLPTTIMLLPWVAIIVAK